MTQIKILVNKSRFVEAPRQFGDAPQKAAPLQAAQLRGVGVAFECTRDFPRDEEAARHSSGFGVLAYGDPCCGWDANRVHLLNHLPFAPGFVFRARPAEPAQESAGGRKGGLLVT